MSDVRIIHGDSRSAARLVPDLVGRVALAVTSPPYHNAIDYESHASDPEANYRPRQEVDYGGEYLDLLDSVWDACWEMLRPGAYLAVNVGTVLDAGYQYPLPQDLTDRLVASRARPWRFERVIYWNKVTAGVKRAGSVIQHPLPGYWHPNIMTEHIILVSKPGRSLKPRADVPPAWLSDVWDVAPVPPRTLPHPAPVPEEIPHRLTRMLTRDDDWIMDPFNGVGTSTKAAADLGRSALGFDIEASYVAFAQGRLGRDSAVRTMQLAVAPVRVDDFVPKTRRSAERTRHGAGLATKR